MAPVPIEPEVRYTGAAVVALHILSVLYFTQRVVASLYCSYKGLSPSQDVRLRLESRRKLVPIFSGLALLALGTALYGGLAYTSLSFQVWAGYRGIGIGTTEEPAFPAVDGSGSGVYKIFPNTSVNITQKASHANQFILDRIRWLSDTPIYQDAFEIITEKARRFWWGQQIDLSLVPWSVLLAIEGRRRGIPNLFAFLCLAHLVSLSFAQNLFFVALLLTPAPLPEVRGPPTRLSHIRDTIIPPKSRNWTLGPGIILLTVIASYTMIFLLPYAAETPSFNRVAGTSRALTFTPLILHAIAPTSWGSIHRNHSKENSVLSDLFKFMAAMNVILHGVATVTGLRYNVPHAHYHRHSVLRPWDIEERSRWERTTTALGKILGATTDHPVVAAVGYDVLISGLSVGIWAAVRSLGADDVLASVVPLYKQRSSAGNAATASDQADSDEIHEQSPAAEPTPAPSSPRRSGRRRTSTSKAKDDENSEPPQPRRRGKSRKDRKDPEEEPGDQNYEPTFEEEVSARGDPLPAQEADLETAGLVWALMSVGGLGLGSAGVFGGECLAR